MVKFLYYREQSRYPNDPGWSQSYTGRFRMETLVIDRIGDWPRRKARIYGSLQEVLNDPANAGCEWVFLHPKGSVLLDEFEHPDGNVVYCVGSDSDGFDGLEVGDLPGATVRIRTPEGREGEWWASWVVPLVCYDRFLYLSGRRK